MGGASSFEEFTGHLPQLRRYARHLTRSADQADDLVQECLMRAIRSADTLKPDAPVRPWLLRILHNVHVSQLRRDRVRAADVAEPEDVRVGAAQHDHMELRNVLDAVNRLPDSQREVICLVALEDLSYAEAAEVLAIPVGTLMSRLARGREALRLMLEGKAVNQFRVVGGRNAG